MFSGENQSVSISTIPKSESIARDHIHSLHLSTTPNNPDSPIFLSLHANECRVLNSKISCPNEKFSIIFTQAKEEYTNDTILRKESTLNTLDFKYLIPFRKISNLWILKKASIKL